MPPSAPVDPYHKWNVFRRGRPIDSFSKRYYNENGIIKAIEICILLMKANMKDRSLIRSRKDVLLAEYNAVIDEMNINYKTIPNTDNPLVASVFVRAFLDDMPSPLLPTSISNRTVDEYKQMASPSLTIANDLLDLQDRHLRLFVYIFKFLQHYLWYTMEPDLFADDDTEKEEEPKLTIDGIATCMAPCITHSVKVEQLKTPHEVEGKNRANELAASFLAMQEAKEKLTKSANVFKYVLENLDDIISMLQYGRPEVVHVYPYTYT